MSDSTSDQLSALGVYKFTEELMSKAPTPGGGGTAALIGSLAAALAAMATNLTIGKKKFLPYEQDHLYIIVRSGDHMRSYELSESARTACSRLNRRLNRSYITAYHYRYKT